MIYADMHCDSITACCNSGGDMSAFEGQVNPSQLKSAGCVAQCFAIFTKGDDAGKDFKRFSAFYNAFLLSHPSIVPVKTFADIVSAQEEGKLAAILTVENLGFLNGNTAGIYALKRAGVKMASLVWNYKNGYAYPNLIFKGEAPDFSAVENRGLTEAGRHAVEILNGSGIIIDVSHLSDGGTEEVLALSTSPIVASHSNCRSVCAVSRNLSDGLIKKIAQKGGVAGLNFCADFIGGEDAFAGLLAHLKHMLNVGGEDFPAIGSDFDGIPRYAQLDNCTHIPALLQYFNDNGVPWRIIEKVAYKNFFRVFRQVCG